MGHKKKEVVTRSEWFRNCNMENYNGRRWCAIWIDSLSNAQKVKLNCGKPLRPIDAVKKHWLETMCKHDLPAEKDAQERADCIKYNIFIRELHQYPCKPRQRAALLATEKSSSLGTGLAVGGILLIILGIILAYWYFFGRQKSARLPKDSAKGTCKTSKSKLGKSRIGSRKSSKRSSQKGSQGNKANKSAKGNKSAKMK